VTLAILAGTGIGAAICLIASGLAPASAPLQEALARLGQPKSERTVGATFDARLGAQLRRLPLVDHAVRSLRTDLRILRRDPDEQTAEIATYGLVGLFWAPVVNAGAWMLGIHIPWLVPAWLSLAGAVGAVIVAVTQLRTRARDARAAFGHALSAWCDVVAMSVSAGHELHAAIFDAADRGRGPAFTELRAALDRGYYAGEAPWDSLAQLGRDLGIHDLVDISAALALAATRVRRSARR
jgi:tight adherence protein C